MLIMCDTAFYAIIKPEHLCKLRSYRDQVMALSLIPQTNEAEARDLSLMELLFCVLEQDTLSLHWLAPKNTS